MNLESILKERIARNGPVTVAEYMELALSHPEHGYYMRSDPLGAAGDFTTAPEISQIFGELMGAWLAEEWRVMGKPKAALIELGPGRGTLLSDALRATKTVAGFHDAISLHLVETSPALKAKQWQALAGKHPRIEWHESIETLPDDMPWLVVANEFFDALPVRQFVFQDGEWKERGIGIGKDDALEFVILSATKDLHPAPGDKFYEYSPLALDIAKIIASHIAAQGGAALIVDYGYADGARADTLQAVKAHQYHDILREPGMADLTCHVDFGALKQAAEEAGAAAHGSVPQGRFLMQLGAGLRVQQLCAQNAQEAQSLMSGLKRLASPDQMGEMFKAMCIVPTGHPKPEGF